jgi:hypothetical protein
MPEWYLLLGVLAAFSLVALVTGPLLALPGGVPLEVALLGMGVAALAGHAVRAARDAVRGRAAAPGRPAPRTLVALVALLFAIQPLARLVGRLRHGLTPWRGRRSHGLAALWRREIVHWSEQWCSPYARLVELETSLRSSCLAVRRGSDHDRWDLQAATGPFGSARLRLLSEEHGHGHQLIRFRTAPRLSRLSLLAVPLAGVAAASAGRDPFAAALLALAAVVLVARSFVDSASAHATLGWAVVAALADSAEPSPVAVTPGAPLVVDRRPPAGREPPGAYPFPAVVPLAPEADGRRVA